MLCSRVIKICHGYDGYKELIGLALIGEKQNFRNAMLNIIPCSFEDFDGQYFGSCPLTLLLINPLLHVLEL